MPTTAPAPPSFDRTLAFQAALGAVLWLWISIKQGYDIEFDILNYHFYNGYALLHDKVFSNIQVSMLQSYYAPLMDAIFYVLASTLSPKAVVIAIALFQSLVFPMLFQLARLVLSGRLGSGIAMNASATALTLLGAGAPINLWEAGGALGDTASAVPVMAALLIMVDALARQRLTLARAATAGALAGAAAGLKLTNLPFALGLLAALCVTLAGLRDTTRRRIITLSVAACIGGMAAAFLVTYGWWGALLYAHFGNPVFPNFNQVFRSPFAVPSAFADPAFALPTWQKKLLFPFVSTSISGRLNPAGLFDLRMAFALPMCVLGLGVAAARRRSPMSDAQGSRCARLALLLFVVIGYVGWLFVFPINRYLVAVDMVAPLACAASIIAIFDTGLAVLAVTAVLAVALPLSADAARSLWWLPGGHRHGDKGGYFGVRFAPPPDLHGGVIAMLGGWPMAFVIPYFPSDATFVRLQGSQLYWSLSFNQLNRTDTAAVRRRAFGNAMGAAVCRRLDHDAGGLFLMRAGTDSKQDLAAMTYYGIAQDGADCVPIANKVGMPIVLCPAKRLPHPECDIDGAPP